MKKQILPDYIVYTLSTKETITLSKKETWEEKVCYALKILRGIFKS